MGNSAATGLEIGNSSSGCCSSVRDTFCSSPAELKQDEAKRSADTPLAKRVLQRSRSGLAESPNIYQVYLQKRKGGKLGLDVDFVRERKVLPVLAVAGGVAEAWNIMHPERPIEPGDSIIDVNGTCDVEEMLDKCKTEQVLELTLRQGLNYDQLVQDLEALIKTKSCGPILIRLAWHDAGVYSTGDRTGGCANAVLRFSGEGEGSFAANAGLPTTALSLLAPISEKYCPDLISHADLWALAANVAIRVMGGPDVPTHFGREDAASAAESVDSQTGRLPSGAGGTAHLCSIFHPKGFCDKDIVTLSGAHTVGRCHLDHSGYEGAWTEEPLSFNNSYFKDLLSKTYLPETTCKGCLQLRSSSGTIMLPSDLALLQSTSFRKHVEAYAADERLFFTDFVQCWVRLQENGLTQLRDIL